MNHSKVKVSAQEAKSQYTRELQTQRINEIVQKMTSSCFTKCVKKPGTKLDRGEQTCLARCVDRYLDSMVITRDTMGQRGAREGKV
mmetsp:Transcript_5494/g.12128  ORF Transcript_5494/g.12128 Transcript_5494/m.12128 type:complete len:86 (+) Transcript_5494:10-267(+)